MRSYTKFQRIAWDPNSALTLLKRCALECRLQPGNVKSPGRDLHWLAMADHWPQCLGCHDIFRQWVWAVPLSSPFPATPVCTRFDNHLLLFLKWVCITKVEGPGLWLNAFWPLLRSWCLTQGLP